MSDRRHTDLFTAAEAMEYLHLTADDERALETLRSTHGLHAARIGKAYMYHRHDLDAVVLRVFGKEPHRMRMAK